MHHHGFASAVPTSLAGLEPIMMMDPCSQAVLALGSLSLIDAVKRAGSDIDTEMKLDSFLPRHHVD